MLECRHCRDGWRLVEYNGYAQGETCTECGGRGVPTCCETDCYEPATREFVERGELYALCDRHHKQWCEDAEV